MNFNNNYESFTISNLQPSSIQKINEIETRIMEDNFENAQELWNSTFQLYQNFIHDTILLGLYVKKQDFALATDIKIHWQKTLDKIEETFEIIFFKALYFTYLGQLFLEEDEFEISNAFLTKATLEFRKIFSNNDFMGIRYCQYQVANNYTILGASGEARYHYRELLEMFSLSPDEIIQYSWFVYLSSKMSKNNTKTRESQLILIKLLNEYPLNAYPRIRESINIPPKQLD